jgi:oligoribonuclease
MNNVIWLDIETTGLDENVHSLLSVGAIRFDEGWTNERKFYQIVHYSDPEKLLWSPTALDMHRKSGLYEKIKEPAASASGLAAMCFNLPPTEGAVVDLQDLDVNLCQWISPLSDHISHTVPKMILAGNSIHFDRKFIKKYLPLFEELLSYRMIDVSGMAEAFNIFSKANIERPEYSHTALNDAYSSIELLNRCLTYLPGYVPKQFYQKE